MAFHPRRPFLILALTPLKKEMELLAQGFQSEGLELKKNQIKGRWYYDVPELNMTLTTAGHGKSQYALVAQFWLQQFPLTRSILCLGAAGGLSQSLEIFDVVIATTTIEHDYKELFNPEATAPTFQCNFPVFIETKLTPTGFRVHQGVIASGDEDIVSEQRGLELASSTDAIAVAWEGAGAARVAKWNKLNFAEIRSITDKAQGDVSGDFFKNLPQCMNHLAQVLIEILKRPS